MFLCIIVNVSLLEPDLFLVYEIHEPSREQMFLCIIVNVSLLKPDLFLVYEIHEHYKN